MDMRKNTIVAELLQSIEHDKKQNSLEIQQLHDQIKEVKGNWENYK